MEKKIETTVIRYIGTAIDLFEGRKSPKEAP